MKNIAIFYHCILSGGSVPINTLAAVGILREQMQALNKSGLAHAAAEIHFGLNGHTDDLEIAKLFAPPKSKFILHGLTATTEIPTMAALREWLPAHPDWLVLYHHIKGVCYPDRALYHVWRRCMEKAVVWGWRDCLAEIANGKDSCGAHWMTPEQFPGQVKSPFWGGTFWWATAKFLLTLPPLPEATWANRFEAENWIGRGLNRPVVKDYHNGWPSMKCA